MSYRLGIASECHTIRRDLIFLKTENVKSGQLTRLYRFVKINFIDDETSRACVYTQTI